VESKGFCFYKATNGIKRHLAIDTLGFPFFTHGTRANLSDDAGLIEMFTLNIDYFKSKPIAVLNKMRYTPLATDAHGGLCPMPYALSPPEHLMLRSKGYIDIPKITILLDHGYHPEYLTQELERIYPEIMTKIQFQLSPKPSKQQKAAQGKCGFVPALAFRGDRALQRPRWSVVKFWLRTLNEP